MAQLLWNHPISAPRVRRLFITGPALAVSRVPRPATTKAPLFRDTTPPGCSSVAKTFKAISHTGIMWPNLPTVAEECGREHGSPRGHLMSYLSLKT